MKKRNSYINILITFVVLASTLACKLFVPSTPTPIPVPESTAEPASIPTIESMATEPIPGLAGFWQDSETLTVHTIIWDGNQYTVISSKNPDSGSHEITDQSWNNGSLTWTYYVTANDTSVTFDTISVDGDSLYTNWNNSRGDNGTETLVRVESDGSSIILPPDPGSNEPMPGLTGVWEDPETLSLHTVIWDGSEYYVVSSIGSDGEIYTVTDQSWVGDTLSWTYYVGSTQTTVTFETIYVDGNSLYTNWNNSNNASGTETLSRKQ
jgi:hypothetical protein